MTRLIFRIVLTSLTLAALLVSCSSKPSLQSYFLESQDKPGFYTQSIPKGILGIDENDLTGDAKTAYNSIEKVNVLFYPNNDKNKANFSKESAKVNAILQNEDYKMLVSHSDDNTKMRMVYDGTQDAIDEIIMYGTSDDMGMGVARIMGDDMQLGSILKLMNEMDKSSVDGTMLQNIMKNFSGKMKEMH
ncbi:MAG: DUF4252 domain-containing protein [Nonlabens sp.]|nr:DUF4252 domain-containing protein [Nonlabens sp.]MDP5100653.1 DUF4252 domain-containing protein [Nonlabens sp.]